MSQDLENKTPGTPQGAQPREVDAPSADYLRSLRERAEQAGIGAVKDVEGLSKDEIQHILHELEVHQVELKMQNDELIRVQLELEVSRDRFSSLYDFAPVGYCTIDRKGIILEANATLHHLLHVPEKTLLGTAIQHYIQAQEQDRFYLYHRDAIRSGVNQRCEIMMGLGESDRFVAQLESRKVPGELDQVWLVVSDISNSRRATEFTARYERVLETLAALEIERNRYRDLFEFVPDGYFVTDDKGLILDVNFAGAALFHSTQEQLTGSPLIDFVALEAQPAFIDRTNSILAMPTASSRVYTGEWVIQTKPKDGDASFVSVSAVLLRERPEHQVRIHWLFQDVTLRKQTEAALEASEAHFSALFKESSIGIRLFNLQGETITSNKAVQEILGYSEDELRKFPFAQLTVSSDQAEDENCFRSVLAGEIDRYTIEKRCVRKDGQLVWVHQVVFLVKNVADAAAFIVALTENISERKQMEIELARVRQLLIDTPEAERLMLAQDLHDGPMQDLYGVLYQIKDLEGKLTGADEETLSRFQFTILQVIRNLRGFAGQLRPPTLKTYGLEKTIRSHAQLFQQDHPEIAISLDLMPDMQRLPERFSLALFRIYQQSLANIVRHAHATRVVIRLIFDENRLIFEIEDDGKGFEVPPRLVDLIQKGHFGLVGTAERAEAIGGSLIIRSSPGMGTTIRVKVDLAN